MAVNLGENYNTGDNWVTSYWTIYHSLTATVSRSGNTVSLSNITAYFKVYGTSGSAYASNYGPCVFYLKNGNTTLAQSASARQSWNTSTLNTMITLYSTSIPNCSFTVGTGDTSHELTLYWTGQSSDSNTSYFNITFPTGNTPPSGLTVSLNSRTWNSANITATLNSWGTTTQARSMETIVVNPSETSSTWPSKGRFVKSVSIGTGSTNTITQDTNNSNATGSYDGGFTLKGCTAFKIAAWAAGQYSDGTYTEEPDGAFDNTTYYTPPSPLDYITKTQTSSDTANQVTHDLTIVGGSSAGNASQTVTTQYRYSTDGGSNYSSWTSAGTGTPWTAQTASFTSHFNNSIKVQAKQIYQSQESAVTTITYTANSAVAPSVSSVTRGATTYNTISITGSISSYGTPSQSPDRDLRVGVSTVYGSFASANCRYTSVGQDTSGTGIVSNSSEMGSLTIKGCQQLYYFTWTTNGVANSSRWGGSSFYTVPDKPGLQVLDDGNGNYQVALTGSDNNENETATYSYKLYDQSETEPGWTTLTTASASTTSTMTSTATALTPGHTYVAKGKMDYQSQDSEVATMTFTVPIAKLYGSVSDVTKLVEKLYAPMWTITDISDQTDRVNYTTFNTMYRQTYTGVEKEPVALSVESGTVSVTFADGTTESLFSSSDYITWGFRDPVQDGTITAVSKSKKVDKLYGSVNGVSKLLFKGAN